MYIHQVLGLAYMIMSAKLPVRLRVLVPAVENAIDGGAYRNGDIIKVRKGRQARGGGGNGVRVVRTPPALPILC